MSYFLCCTIRRPPWQRALRVRQENMLMKANIPIKKLAIVALKLSPSNGVCDLRTGILIHNSLVLTSHKNLPSKKSAENGEIVLTDVYSDPSSYSTAPPLSGRHSQVLTRKLLPTRYFLTNPSLGVTIVGCDAVSSEVPLDIETAKVPDILNVGRSIYVLGHVEQDDKRKGLITFGEGRICSEDEQVIEFYSLDGNVWAPGSAGFDEQGNFAFVVGDSKSPSMQKRPPAKKDSGPKQPGILVQFIREWMRTVWDLNFDELSKKNTKEGCTDPSTPIDTAAKTVREVSSSACKPREKGTQVVDLPLHSSPRECVTSRKDCTTAVQYDLASLGSPILGFTEPSSDNSANVDAEGLSSGLGGIADLGAKEFPTYRLVEPKHPGREEELSLEELSRDTCRSPHDDNFVTGFVKVKYFNKNTFPPDRMPAIDHPNQDSNGGSWYNWGKRAPEPDPGLSPKETAETASGHQGEVVENPQGRDRTSGQEALQRPVTSNPQQDLNSWYDWGKIALQMAVSDIPKEELNGDSWYDWGKREPTSSRPLSPKESGKATLVEVCPQESGLQPLRAETPLHKSSMSHNWLRPNAPLEEMQSDSHQGSPRTSSPELVSPISRFQRPKPTLHQTVNSPCEFAFGQIHRSATSPRSPSKADAAPWKPPSGHASGDPGSPPQNVKLVFEERKIMPVTHSLQQGAPRLLCELRKRGYDQKKPLEKRRERMKPGKSPGKPPWSAHSTVHKEDDNRKLATLPPRFAKPGEFPAGLFSSEALASPKPTGDRRKEIRPTGWSRMPAVRGIAKHRESLDHYPKRRARRCFQSSCMPNNPPVRNKKCERQLILKHARKALGPIASIVRAQTNMKTSDEKQISCLQAPKGTLSFASESPGGPAVDAKKTVSPKISSCKQIRRDEEILNEIERLQAVLRSPGLGSCPKQNGTDGRQEEGPEVNCSGMATSPRDNLTNRFNSKTTGQKSERDIGFSCFQYWKIFISQRRDAAVESMKAVFLPHPAARIEGHAQRRIAGSPRTSPIGSPRHGDLRKIACSAATALYKMDDTHGSPKLSNLRNRHPHRPHCSQEAVSLQENISSAFVFKSPGQSPQRPREKSSSPCTPGPQQLVEVEYATVSSKTPCLSWNGALCCDEFNVKPEELQGFQNPQPESPKGVYGPHSRPGTAAKAFSSPIRVSPSHTTTPDSRLDGETTSAPSKHRFTSSGVPRKVQRVCSTGPGRPRWAVTRAGSRSTPPTGLGALRDGKRTMGKPGGKRISSVDVGMETMIFDTINEKAPILKNSVAEQRLLLPAPCLLLGCSGSPDSKLALGIRSKPKLSIASSRKRPRVAQNATSTRRRLQANTAEIGTNVICSCSEDGSYLSEMGTIVRSEARAPTPGQSRPAFADQHRKLWRP